MRRSILGALFSAVCLCGTSAAPASAATVVTLPAAASIQGVVPFYTDARVFNTSYAAQVTVTATYRCFLGACAPTPPQIVFDLAPRQSRAFNDLVAATFREPNTAGGVEIAFDAPSQQVVVTSRLYSTVPAPTVGMFIPGLDASAAAEFSVLTSVRNGGPGAGFRTNAGVFNPGDAAGLVTFTVYADGVRVGGAVQRRVEAHSGLQVNAIFIEAGAAGSQTGNGVILVQSDVPVFSYAAVIDNATSDPYFVVGAADGAPVPTTTPSAGPSPTLGPATRTPTGGGTSPTFTATAGISPSPTPTGPTPTPSITLTPSLTFTPSLTLTPSLTPTATQTFTPSLTPTITPTFTATRTPSPTFTGTRTFSPTQTGSATATPSVTRSPTPSPTGSGTFTATITASLTPTLTPTVSVTRTPTLTPTVNPNHVVLVGQGGTNFVDSVSGTSTTTINAGQTVEWQWVGNFHSTTSGTCTPGGCTAGPPCPLCTPWDSGVQNSGATFTRTFTASNTYTYFCQVHGFMMQGTIVVNP